jgi:peptidoglycan hydrolase-like protein with peptidoglycan-binding domain
MAVVIPGVAYAISRPGAGGEDESAPTPVASALGSTAPATTTASSVPASAAPAVVFDHPVGPGSTGGKVRALQSRLRELAFDPGPVDGVFGPATERAVWAFEKFIEDVLIDGVTGVVDPDRWDRMNESISIRPRRQNVGTHVEVLLPKQVAVVYRDNVATLVTHVSSGTGEEWCATVLVDEDDGTQSEQAICGVATTPGGVFHVERRIEGWRNSKLGRLYNPLYFNYGIALHGASNVPSVPASRGCVRVPMHIAEYLPDLIADGDLVYVFDGVEQPETYGAQLPVFDYPDPRATTTTTTPTTTAASTTSTVPRSAPATATTTPHTHPSSTSSPPTATTQPLGAGSG